MYGKTEAQAGWDDRHLNTKLRWTQAVWLEFLLLRSAHCYRFTGNKGTEEHVKWYYRDTFHKAQNVGNFTGQMTHVLQQVNCLYPDHFSVIFAKWCWGKRKSIPQGQTASMLTSCYKNCGFLKFSVPLQNTFIESAGVTSPSPSPSWDSGRRGTNTNIMFMLPSLLWLIKSFVSDSLMFSASLQAVTSLQVAWMYSRASLSQYIISLWLKEPLWRKGG